jgi:sodium/proline symporter
METAIELQEGVSGWALVSFLLYLAGIIGIGVYASRFSSAGISNYFIGGRKINRFVMALSAVVSGRSAWLLLGMTGMAYSSGTSAVWAVVGYIFVEIFLFLYYARRLRRYSEVRDCITVPDFFAGRFGRHATTIRLVMVFIILIFMVGYVSAQFVAGGKTFAAGFGMDPNLGILTTAVIVLLYTMVGGFLAVSLTDMLQAFLMILALVVLPTVAIWDVGGWSVVVEQLTALDPTLVDPYALTIGAAIGSLGIGLGSPGNPHIISRYLSIDDEKQLRVACLVGTFWNIIMAWGALFAGLAGRVIFPEISMLPGQDTENLFPLLAQTYLPAFLFGLVIAAVFAAIMSSADSQLLVAASSVVRDFYEKVYAEGRELSQKFLVRTSRMVVFVLVAISLLAGFMAEDLVYWLVLFAWAGLGAALGPTSILALYWRGTTGPGVVAGMLTGAAVTILWRLSEPLQLYELIPGFAAGLLATVVVSLFTKKPEQTAEDFEIMKGTTAVKPKYNAPE